VADANWAFLQVLGPRLDREATVRGATAEAATLAALWAMPEPTVTDLVAMRTRRPTLPGKLVS
jgi:hypothetical protein